MRPVPNDAPRDADKFYGPPFIPGVKGHVWECENRAEYVAAVKLYEEAEANCNTCKHLKRHQHPKFPGGWIEATCGLKGVALRFHPDDPMHMPCYVNRRP